MDKKKTLWLVGCGAGCLVGVMIPLIMVVWLGFGQSQGPPLQIILEADLAEGQAPPAGSMEATRIIVKNRVDDLICHLAWQNCIAGITRSVVQLQDDQRILIELPGVSDHELVIKTIRETGLLEIVDTGPEPVPEGTVIQTTLGPEGNGAGPVYETIITGGDLDQVSKAHLNPDTRTVEISFELKPEGGQRFGDYTEANIGNFACIVLDKVVLSCPIVRARIDSKAVISLGDVSLAEGEALAVQLRYGALPVPLKVVSFQ